MVTRLLIALVLLAATAQGQVVRRVLRPDLGSQTNGTGMVGWWSLDDTSDLSGSALYLTPVSGTNFVPARLGRGSSHNGTNFHKAVFSSLYSFSSASVFTVMAWVRIRAALPESGYVERAIVSQRVSTAGGNLHGWGLSYFYYAPAPYNGYNVGVLFWGGKEMLCNQKLNVGQWYHVATAYNGSTGQVYLDGLPVTTANRGSGGNVSSAQLNIGAHDNVPDTTRIFNGEIDDARVYNRVLNAAEIKALYYLRRPSQ
jgi:hypothetical protein